VALLSLKCVLFDLSELIRAQSTLGHFQFLPELKYGSLCLTVGGIIVENFSLFCRLLIGTLLADNMLSFFSYVLQTSCFLTDCI